MSEITHIICAHCGSSNSINNREPAKPILQILKGELFFFCGRCGVSYHLGVPQGSPWTASSIRLPTHMYSVLGFVTSGPMVRGDPMQDLVSYNPETGNWHQGVDGEDVFVTVTHWMEKPDDPV